MKALNLFLALASMTSMATILAAGGARAEPAPAVGIHGMLLFGEQATYVSHLPMFHAPHDSQLILKVKLDGTTGVAAYESAKQAGKTLFTIVPEKMDLSKVASGAKESFKAVIYDGHFERGGQALGSAQVRVEKIVLSASLAGLPAPTGQSKYLVFGEVGEYFAAHLIRTMPSFDAILKVSRPYDLFIPHCRTRVCADPEQTPIEDSKLPLAISGPAEAKGVPAETSLGSTFESIADLQQVISVEEGDLSH